MRDCGHCELSPGFPGPVRVILHEIGSTKRAQHPRWSSVTTVPRCAWDAFSASTAFCHAYCWQSCPSHLRTNSARIRSVEPERLHARLQCGLGLLRVSCALKPEEWMMAMTPFDFFIARTNVKPHRARPCRHNLSCLHGCLVSATS